MSKQTMRSFWSCLILFVVSAACVHRAFGDILITKRGTKYEGKVTREGNTYTLVRPGGGRITFPASIVQEVIRKELPAKAPPREEDDPAVRSAVRALGAEVLKAQQQLRESTRRARARHAKAAAAGAADRGLQRKELAEYAALEKRLVGARALLAKARQAMTPVAKDSQRLGEVRAEWQAQITAATGAVLKDAKRIEDTHAVAGASAGAKDEWPGWRGPNRDGKSPDTGLLKEWPDGGPKLLWQADGIGSGFSSVAVTGGMVYITGDKDGRLIVFAFDMNGKPKWQKGVDKAWTRSRPGARSTPMIHRGKLYLVSGNGVVVCLDAKSGKGAWSREMREFGGRSGGWGYAESVLIYKDWAVVKPGGRNCIVALDKATGKNVWASTGFSGGPEYGSCLAFTYQKKPMIVTGTRSGIVCFDAANGAKLWSNPFSTGNTANCPTPAYADGHVFWANGYGKGGICMKLKRVGTTVSADEAWTTRDMVCHHGGYIIHEGLIYGNNGGGWACLDLKTGQAKWKERGVGKGSLCWADGMLYLFSESRGRMGLATCSPDGLEMKGTFSVEGSGPSWAHPVVIGGRLYLRYDTHLYCFDVKAK